MFVLNQGSNRRGINVCPTCGFAADPAAKEKRGDHKTKYGRSCGTRNLINVSLGHEFSTDILKITLPKHSFRIAVEENVEEKDVYLSVMYAILEGASKALDISRGDISGCVTVNQEIILYDDTPGGSGFVKHIYSRIEDVLRAALNKVSGNCGCTEETSCYGCLRNYSNQFFHDILSKGLAYKYIAWLLNEIVMDYSKVLLIETWKMDQEELQNFVVKKLIPLADGFWGKFSYQFFITDDLDFFVCRMCPECGYMTRNRIGPFKIAQKLPDS